MSSILENQTTSLDLKSGNLEFQWIPYCTATRLEKWSQESMSPTRAGQFPTKLELPLYISTTCTKNLNEINCDFIFKKRSWNLELTFRFLLLQFFPQVGVQPQEADSLHLLHAHAQVDMCK